MTDATAGADGRDPTRLGGKTWFTSTLLITFTLMVAVACIVVLSCTLTQTRVATTAIDGVSISIAKLNYVGRSWANLSSDRRKLEDLEKEGKELAMEVGQARVFVISTEGELRDKLIAFRYRLQEGEPQLASEMNKIAGPDNKISERVLSEQCGLILGNKSFLVGRNVEFGKAIDAVEMACNGYRTALERYNGTTTVFDIKTNEIELAQKRLDDSRKGIFDLIKPNLDPNTIAKIENAFYELNIDNYLCGHGNKDCGPVGGLLTRGLYHLLTLPTDLLTLLLVILMGVLGSALQITHAYFMRGQSQSIGGYFQRISVGAMTALVIFIVAKAGVPVIADPSRLGGESPINPYFVSFLAIISGLLSENAIANVQAQGAKLFGGGEGEPKRWARRDLTPELDSEKLTVQDIATHLGVDEKSAAAMIKGERALDGTQQKMMTISLRRNPREIFTDIPPPSGGAPTSERVADRAPAA